MSDDKRIAFDASGLSGPRFEALHGVNNQTLAGWIKKGKPKALRVIPYDS